MKRWKKALSCVLALIMIVCLLSVSAMAAEDDTAKKPTVEDQLDGATWIYVSNDGTGDGTTESTPITFAEAFRTINKDKSDAKYVISLTEDIDYASDLQLSKYHTTTILGNGNALSSNGSWRLRIIYGVLHLGLADGSDTLTLNGISVSPYRGTTYLYDGVRIIGADDRNSSCFDTRSGSNIYMYGGELCNASGWCCVLFNDSTAAFHMYGGKIHDADTGVHFNTAGTFNMYGGEIYGISGQGVELAPNAIFNMYGGKFTDCGHNGFGVVCLSGWGESSVHIYGGEFCNNHSSAIRGTKGNTLEINGDVKFINNHSSYGGALHIFCEATITGAQFQNNHADYFGGAICGSNSGGNITLTDVTFDGNTANSGGAVYGKNNCTVTINGGKFSGNCAEENGDDIAITEDARLVLNTEGTSWFYDGAGDPDGDNHRYNDELESGEKYVKEFTETDYTGTIALKAAAQDDPTLPGGLLGGLLGKAPSQVLGSFVDVTPMDYYYDAVNWAVENDITTGTGRLSFSPDEPCTRAQAVTFLWRAAGCPAPANSATPFTDVEAGSYYEKAVAWAVENGVTKGTSATTFSPYASCTRAQIVTFLYRAFGAPVDAAASFTDMAADAYYAPAVAWAAANRVTGGTAPAVFSPDAPSTRAQIVTFLYRCQA